MPTAEIGLPAVRHRATAVLSGARRCCTDGGLGTEGGSARTVQRQYRQRAVSIERTRQREGALVRDAVVREEQVSDSVVQLDALCKPRGAHVADLVGSEVQLAERRAAVALQQGPERDGSAVAQREPCPTQRTRLPTVRRCVLWESGSIGKEVAAFRGRDAQRAGKKRESGPRSCTRPSRGTATQPWPSMHPFALVAPPPRKL